MLPRFIWRKASETRFRLIAQNTPDAIYALIHVEARDQLFASIYAAMERKASELLYPCRVRHKDGHYIWREEHARFVYDISGALSMTYVICRDATGRKAQEHARRHPGDLHQVALLGAGRWLHPPPIFKNAMSRTCSMRELPDMSPRPRQSTPERASAGKPT